MRVLGIDPGISVVGWGVVEGGRQQLSLVSSGRMCLNSKMPFPEKLKVISAEVESLIGKFNPQVLSIENPFLANNPETLAKVSRVVGAVEITAMNNGLPVAGYSVAEIKQAVVGYGRAEKSQVREMVKLLLEMRELPRSFDAADALACAICHHNMSTQG